MIGYHAYTGGTGTTATSTATCTYDTLNRMASETETRGATPSRTTSLSYIGMTGNVAEEQQSSGRTLQTTVAGWVKWENQIAPVSGSGVAP